MSYCESRPEIYEASGKQAMPYVTALRAILRAVNKRRSLAYGTLDSADGKHCALGCFWADHPGISLPKNLIDAIAAKNDSLSDRAMPKTRWKRVQRWLRQQVSYFE